MDYALLISIAAFLLIAGLALMYLTLRGNKPFRPTDGFQWAAVGLSSVLVVLAGYLLVLLMTYPDSINRPGVETVGLNESAQNFPFRLVADDTAMELGDLEGNVVLLNFWATWCAPCLMELPELNRLQEEYEEEGLVVLTVSDEPRADLQAFEQTLPLGTMSAYISNPAILEEPFRQVIDVRPISFVIDREGIVRESIVGAGSFAMFEGMVMPYLNRDVAER